MYVNRVLVSHYNLERGLGFRGSCSILLFPLHIYVLCRVASSDAKSIPRIWGRHSELDKEVYVEQPPSFENQDMLDFVYHKVEVILH